MGSEDFEIYPTGKIDMGKWCDHCARYNARYSVCDIIIIHKKTGKVLLQKRNHEPRKGWWTVAGGYLDWNETLEECAIREAKEELGYDLKEITFFTNVSDITRDEDGKQNIDHVYIAYVNHDPPKIDPNEVTEFAWFDFSNLPENIAFNHRKTLLKFKDHHKL